MIKVFLDANIVISVGLPPYGPEFARVIDLVEAGRIEILTTDLTKAEVARYYVKRDFDEIKCICKSKFREKVKDSADTQIPTISEEELWNSLKVKYKHLVNESFEQVTANELKVNDVQTNKVFQEYYNERGLFAVGRGKKHQFPDAFVFELLKEEVSQKEPIIIVSKDGDFEQPVGNQEHITLVKSLPSLFSSLGLKLEAPKIESFLKQNVDLLTSLVDDELSNWSLTGDILDSEITETEVTAISFDDVIAFESAERGGSILVVGQFYAVTLVNFMFPDEGPSVHGFDTVHNQNEIKLEIDVSLSIAVDEKGEPAEIKELEFRNDNFGYVKLDPYVDYW